jgi:hypothetical protein
MAQVLLIGGTGTGKSTSLSYLNPKETFIIRVVNKALPFKGWKGVYTECTPGQIESGNMYTTYNFDTIIKLIELLDKKRPDIKNLIIDDTQYCMGFEYMQNAKQKGYDLFKDLASNLFQVMKRLEALRTDLNVCLTWHPEIDLDVNGNKVVKAKTVGKLFDSAVNLEGMFTYVIYSELVEKNGELLYQFRTQNTGSNTGKTPMGCFNDLYIPNNMQLVFDTINKFENG